METRSSPNEDLRTDLITAAGSGDYQRLETLFEEARTSAPFNMDLDHAFATGVGWAMVEAARNGHLDILEFLLKNIQVVEEYGAKIGATGSLLPSWLNQALAASTKDGQLETRSKRGRRTY